MASVDDLLRRLHHQAAGLRPSGNTDRQFDAYLRGWKPLAAAAGRVLGDLDPRPEDRELYVLLQSLALRQDTAPAGRDRGLESLALVVGAIGDLIRSSPAAVGTAGQVQRSRLQASIQAALHAAARATVDLARDAHQPASAETVRKLAETTELAALLPPLARVSTLERITAPTPDGADETVQRWAKIAGQTFRNYRIVTGIALQDAAATLAILCQVTATSLREAARRRVLDPFEAREAARLLDDASTQWRKAANWPTTVQLGGRAHEHREAAEAVRAALTGPPLARLTLRERVHTLRAAVASADAIGGLQSATVARLVRESGLWVARERENLRPPGVQRRHIKLDWEVMPRGHPAGRLLADQARSAHTALTAASTAVNQAVLPAAPLRGDAGRIALVDHRIVADWWEAVAPTARPRRPEDERPAGSSRPSVHRAIGR
jgi:hypothetical protein